MTSEITLTLIVLGATILLFVLEIVRVDVTAMLVMLALAWLGLVTPAEAISGFASNAVLAMIGVMILGYGLERSGVTNRITHPILRLAGASERRLVGLTSVAVGALSGFIQNIGAAALFLPALMRLSRSARIPPGRILMPVGFAAILGGSLTMVASGPLIILGDLLRQGGERPFHLFSVTPIGLVLLAAGILYFLLFGRRVLPAAEEQAPPASAQQALIETWDLPTTITQYVVAHESPLIGQTREEVPLLEGYGLSLLALVEAGEIQYGPWRFTRFAAGQALALLGSEAAAGRFAADYGLMPRKRGRHYESLRSAREAGFAELIIPPGSKIAGQTLRAIAMRKTYGVEPFLLLSGEEQRGGDFSDQELRPGDALIVHGPWANIQALDDRSNFVLITPIEAAGVVRSKPVAAVLCFAGALALTIAGASLAISLLSGALAMILLGVVPIESAYRAVRWRVVFLLAGLIPLGIAMEKSGAAAYLATQGMQVLAGEPTLLVLLAVGLLTTLFSLFMSNVAATVMLVPLVMSLGGMLEIAPRALALLVGICASNSFLLPTHQVNALFMAPGGYRSRDYLRAGGWMSLIFLVLAVGMVRLLFV